MDREGIRRLAAEQLGLATSPFRFADDEAGYREAVAEIGLPCVVKPVMSSSGKGQSLVRDIAQVGAAWAYAQGGGRAGAGKVIVEGFVPFDYEITLLTVTQNNGTTLFCPPIGHRQERGDYQESWQPQIMDPAHLTEAQDMADRVTKALGGSGIWGVEFFITKEGAYFSELSPRPHDTGMVTLAGTQNFSEFELHARAVLGLPIPEIELLKNGASAVVLATSSSDYIPVFKGIEKAAGHPKSDLRIFGKPFTRPYRRMGVALTYGNESIEELVDKAKQIAAEIEVS
jgi:phosphoribosylglycinamide formyltransferase 2